MCLRDNLHLDHMPRGRNIHVGVGAYLLVRGDAYVANPIGLERIARPQRRSLEVLHERRIAHAVVDLHVEQAIVHLAARDRQYLGAHEGRIGYGHHARRRFDDFAVHLHHDRAGLGLEELAERPRNDAPVPLPERLTGQSRDRAQAHTGALQEVLRSRIAARCDAAHVDVARRPHPDELARVVNAERYPQRARDIVRGAGGNDAEHGGRAAELGCDLADGPVAPRDHDQRVARVDGLARKLPCCSPGSLETDARLNAMRAQTAHDPGETCGIVFVVTPRVRVEDETGGFELAVAGGVASETSLAGRGQAALYTIDVGLEREKSALVSLETGRRLLDPGEQLLVLVLFDKQGAEEIGLR